MGTFYNPKIVTDGLILHLDAGNRKSYPGTGSVWYDLKKSGRNGTITNAVWSSANAGIFTMNTSQYISIANTDFRTGTYTINIVCRLNSGTNRRILSGTSNNWLLGAWNGYIETYYANGWVNTYLGSPLADSEWKFYTATVNTASDNYKLYVNGVLKYDNNAGSQGPYGLSINTGYAGNESSDCSVSFISAYNRVLTPSEILQNYNAIKNRFVKEEEATIPQEGLHTWLESDYGVITIDGAGNEQTTPVSGNYVKRWESKVGTINFAQTTTTAMPIYRIDSNGIPYLSFEGNDTLNATVGNYNFASTAITSWFAGWYRTGTATHQDFFSVTTGGAGWPGMDLYARQSYGTTNSISHGVSSSPGPKSMSVTLTNQSQVNAFQAVHFDLSPIIGGTNRAWLNNGSAVSGTNTAATLDPQSYPATPTLGRYGGNYNYLTGRVYYFVVYSGVQPDHTTMYNYFSTKYQYT